MSLSENPQQMQSEPGPSMPPTAGGTVTAETKLDNAIQHACKMLDAIYKPQSDDEWIRHSLDHVWLTVFTFVQDVGDSNLEKRLRKLSEFKSHVTPGSDQERKLVNLVRSMVKQEAPWRDLLKNEAFFKSEKEEETDLVIPDPALTEATTLAWDIEYKGDLAHVLLDTIADYLSADKDPYARLTAVVNSSGTGKSRMVDQLGTEVITVPMCLRRTRKGFPPPDEDLREWLASDTRDQRTVQKKLHGFTYSLLTVTYKRLKTIEEEREISKIRLDQAIAEILPQEKRDEYVTLITDRQKGLASAFREHMTKGQTYHTTNPYRNVFYRDVINEAKEFVGKCEESEHVRYTTPGGEGLKEAGEKLCRFIDEDKLLDSKKGPRRPLVILAFDEAGTLTDNPPNEEDWNLFSELCRVLRQINHLQIFSLFLSTAGRFRQFSPDIHHEKSARARDPEYRPLDPILEISFDDIEYPASMDTVTIERVVGIDWISHLGRPLFGSYWDKLEWDYRNESVLMDYAKQKLLGGPDTLEEQVREGSLACLSTRLALQFNMDKTAHDVAYAQVKWHMRLCIAATAGLEKMVTIPGSEPLLAEAAYQLMKAREGVKKSAVCHLAMHSDLNCIDRGRCGELVAALLIMQACDAAREFSNGRCVSVVDFMKALLPPQKYNTLLQSAPTSLPKNHDDQRTFKAIFEDWRMWFNHIIKIERKELISIDYLWEFVVRGAMILCTTNQEGIDIVLPVCHMTQKLGPDSVTAIIIQVKNTKDYKATLQGHLFDAMDTVVKSTIFCKLPEPGVDCDPDCDCEPTTKTPAEPEKKRRKVAHPEPEKVNPKAVIRMVMALASPEPAVVFKDRPEKMHHFDGFTTFDIWLAGLSAETFRQIQDEDLEHYKTLLEHSLAPHDAFELKDVAQIGKKAKKSRGSRRRKMVPLAFPEHAHHRIHQVKDQ